MDEDTSTSARGDAAYREQRDAVAKRNVEAHRRGQAERKTRDAKAADRDRVESAREAEQLDKLNNQIAKDRSGRGR
jgi:hypothetical protein